MSASFLDSPGITSSELASQQEAASLEAVSDLSCSVSPTSGQAPIEHPPAITRGERQLPVFCPQCGTRIEIRKGLCGNRLIDAILLQAQRIGAELECQRCQTRFVFQKLEDIPEEKRERNKQQAMASKF